MNSSYCYKKYIKHVLEKKNDDSKIMTDDEVFTNANIRLSIKSLENITKCDNQKFKMFSFYFLGYLFNFKLVLEKTFSVYKCYLYLKEIFYLSTFKSINYFN